MNVDSALLRLCSWQNWYRAVDKKGQHYGLGQLVKAFGWASSTLASENRNVVRRPILENKCVACGNAPSTNSTGDHLIALSKGGPQSIENHAPFCRSCNSSKGDKDLLEWWFVVKGRSLLDLNIDVLTAYLRMAHRYHNLYVAAPLEYEMAITEAAATMPSNLSTYFLDPARDI